MLPMVMHEGREALDIALLQRGLAAQAEAYVAAYNQWGLWIILIKGLTPIPYKLVTIASGFAGYNIWLFIL